MLDANLDILSHVNSICSSSLYVGLESICLIKPPYTLLYGLPTIHINKLQKVQNQCCFQTCNQHPSYLSHYSCFKRSSLVPFQIQN